MEYFTLFNLQREPFGNSPDPEMFYRSASHHQCLLELETAIRLRRGLSVVIGEIGTGKSTICRQLIRNLSEQGAPAAVHLLLEPEFASPREFLEWIAESCGLPAGPNNSERQLKEDFKNHLFEQGAKQGGIMVLIIDEGQKLPTFCLEILREFLNYETNQHKLLQIVIFAQEEFLAALQEKRNFADRITFFTHLRPLSFTKTRQLIRFRLQHAASADEPAPEFFSFPAYWAVYRATGGYPRKIVMLCSQVLLAMIIQNRTRATAALVRFCAAQRRGCYLDPTEHGRVTGPDRINRPTALQRRGRPRPSVGFSLSRAGAGVALLLLAALPGAVYYAGWPLARPTPLNPVWADHPAPTEIEDKNAPRPEAALPAPEATEVAATDRTGDETPPPAVTVKCQPEPEIADKAQDISPGSSAPQPPGTLTDQRLAATATWLAQVDQDRLTIQLLLIQDNPGALANFLDEADRLHLLENIYLYPIRYQNRPAWNILYHDYPDRGAVAQAIAGLPASLQSHSPFARNIRSVADRFRLTNNALFFPIYR